MTSHADQSAGRQTADADQCRALSVHLGNLIALFDNLNVTLGDERAAIAENSSTALLAATTRKLTACEALEQLLATMPDLQDQLDNAISTAPTQWSEKLSSQRKILFSAGIHAKDYNLVNGKVITHGQQSLQEINQLLNNADANGIYGRTGQRRNAPARNAIAKA